MLAILSLGVKLVFAAAAAVCWGGYLYMLRYVLGLRTNRTTWLTAPGEVVGFEDEQLELNRSTLTTTRLLVRFQPLAGPPVTALSPTGSTYARRHYPLGRRLTVRHAPTDPTTFVVQGFDTGNYRVLLLLFGLLGGLLLGLSVAVFRHLAAAPGF